jgi:hypothetical protein
MKSAYELAMERLEKESGPSRTLTDDQKAAIAELDKKFDARIAEKKLEFEQRLAAAPQEGDSIRQEMAEAVQALEQERDREKDAVWNAG